MFGKQSKHSRYTPCLRWMCFCMSLCNLPFCCSVHQLLVTANIFFFLLLVQVAFSVCVLFLKWFVDKPSPKIWIISFSVKLAMCMMLILFFFLYKWRAFTTAVLKSTSKATLWYQWIVQWLTSGLIYQSPAYAYCKIV